MSGVEWSGVRGCNGTIIMKKESESEGEEEVETSESDVLLY